MNDRAGLMSRATSWRITIQRPQIFPCIEVIVRRVIKRWVASQAYILSHSIFSRVPSVCTGWMKHVGLSSYGWPKFMIEVEKVYCHSNAKYVSLVALPVEVSPEDYI